MDLDPCFVGLVHSDEGGDVVVVHSRLLDADECSHFKQQLHQPSGSREFQVLLQWIPRVERAE